MEGDLDFLEAVDQESPGFFRKKDSFLGQYWITNAIDYGDLAVVKWMISKGATLDFSSETGFSVLHSAIDSPSKEKYRILEVLMSNGANPNIRGVNDYTPAHLAAVNNDVEALKLLLKYGADFSIRTRLDLYATPFEEARSCGGATDAVALLESMGAGF